MPSKDVWNIRREACGVLTMKKYSLLILILANLVPVAGIFLFNWDVFSILFFYWIESAVVGLFNIAKMFMIKSVNAFGVSHKTSGIVFFIVHYSLFMLGHGVFLYALFAPVDIRASTIILAVISLTISHGVSFVTNYIGHKEYEKVTLSQQMVAPYGRIVFMHITIILCGFLISLTGTNQVLLIALIIFKITIDVITHLKEHTKLGTYFRVEAGE
jgi:hypothetical protein